MTAPSSSAAASPDSRIPVTVLTGFLGSGKTTVLNFLVRQPQFARALVIINEFGSVAIDHALVTHSLETPLVELDSGCVCCTVRGDLVRTLRDATWRFARNNQRQFDQVLIETTGLANPAPILHTLLRHPQVAPHYRLNSVLTTVDLIRGDSILDRHPEAVRQVAMADELLLTWADVATLKQAWGTLERLTAINPNAMNHYVKQGEFDRNVGMLGWSPTRLRGSTQWRHAGAYRSERGIAHGASLPDALTSSHDADTRQHDARIRALCCTLDAPVDRERLLRWQEALTAATGERLLRFKGIFNIAGDSQRWALHGVQHVFHPPERLPPDSVASADERSHLVFITEDVTDETLLATLPLLTG